MWLCKKLLPVALIIVLFAESHGAPGNGYYQIIGSRSIRPRNDYHVAISIRNTSGTTSVKGAIDGISKNGTNVYIEQTTLIDPFSTKLLSFKIPDIPKGSYRFKINLRGGLEFTENYPLEYIDKLWSVFIQTDKSIYKPKSTISFVVVLLDSNLKPIMRPGNDVFVQIKDDRGNIVKMWNNIKTPRGVFSEKFVLGKNPVPGTWNITVNIDGRQFYKEVKVADYVLPEFKIDIYTEKHVTFRDQKINALILAQTEKGKKIKGEATVTIFPIIHSDIIQPVFQNPVRKIVEIDGSAKVEFDIKKELQLSDEFERSVIMDVAVEEALTGRRENNSAKIHVHKYDYRIDFIKTSDYFKPGLKYRLYIKVSNHDGLPIDSESDLTVRYGFSRDGYFKEERSYILDSDGIVKLEYQMPKKIKPDTVLRLEAEYKGQKQKMFPVLPGLSESQVYLQVTQETNKPTVNKDIKFSISCNEPINYINYIVLGRGDILLSKTIQIPNTTDYSFQITAIRAMAPVSHLIVSYIRPNGEIIGDSIDIEVSGLFQNFIEIKTSQYNTKPEADVDISVKAQPFSFVHLMAIDKNNENSNSEHENFFENIIRDLLSYDSSAITPYPFALRGEKLNFYWRGGFNIYEGIHDAGGNIITNANFAETQIYKSQPINTLSTTPKPYGRFGLPVEHPTRPPLAGPYAFSKIPQQHLTKLYLSSDIADTWIFTNFSTRNDGTFSLKRKTPTSLTNWVLTGFAVDPIFGLGLINKPEEVKVSKPMVLKFDTPSFLRKNELFTLPVYVFNNLDSDVIVEVTLHNANQDFSFIDIRNSSYIKKKIELYQKRRLNINKNSNSSVAFTFIVNKVGLAEIKVTASSIIAQDVLIKHLEVKPEGETQYHSKTLLINLKDTRQLKSVLNFSIPKNVIPNTEKVEVSIMGDLLSPAISHLNQLIHLPTGCGEQNLMYLMSSIITLKYLRGNQGIRVIENEALDMLEKHYQDQLHFRKSDGSFIAFGNKEEPSSVWLTAYSLLALVQAKEFIYVDPAIFSKGFEWLASNQQRNGSFTEIGPIIFKDIQYGDENSLSLTAFVVLTFSKHNKFIDSQETLKYKQIIDKGLDYIARYMNTQSPTFSVALCSYVMFINNHIIRQNAFDLLDSRAKLDKNLKWWIAEEPKNTTKYRQKQVPQSTAIITTSFALLSFLQNKLVAETQPILNWLVNQSNELGGFTNSFDTVIGLYAFSKMMEALPPSNIRMQLNPVNGGTKEFHINSNNALIEQKVELEKYTRNITVEAQGTGFALVKINYQYNVNVTEPLPMFILDPQIDKNSNINHLQISVCARYVKGIKKNEASNMAVMEIDLPSGYYVDTNTLASLERSKHAQKVETSNELTHVTLYFNNITNDQDYCPTFSALRTFNVANQKPTAVILYDYYETSQRARTFYRGLKTSICEVCVDNSCLNKCSPKNEPLTGESQTGSSEQINLMDYIILLPLFLVCYH